MSAPFLVAVSPAHVCDPGIPIAATRAGRTGLLDLGLFSAADVRRDACRRLTVGVRGQSWGLRCDLLDGTVELAETLATCGFDADVRLPLLVLAGVPEPDAANAADLLAVARSSAGGVFLEACSPEQALAAEAAGFDGVLLKGNEAGGRVGATSTFLFLQQVHGRLRIPFWVQGGIGPHTAAAARLAGASGVVLGEQLWLTRESSLSPREREAIRPLDGSETICLGDERGRFRFLARAARTRLQELDRRLTAGAAWPETLYEELRATADQSADPAAALVPLGQEAGLAGRLAERHHSVAGVLQAFDRQIATCLEAAPRQRALAAGGPWAEAHGTRYPIAQGPMTRVSDVAPFCREVAAAGGLPFLALALLRAPAIRDLLARTKEGLAGRPWGVGMLGFVPNDLRREQLAEVLANPPAFAIIAGGRPSQARELEERGIPTALHVPSRGLLEAFLRDGARRFVLEGRECGGHVGPQASFPLWESAIDTLAHAELADPENVHVLFAGGIHDDLSAALVAAAAAPLVDRGMKIGVLMGTAYLFTREAVTAGAITAEFQRQALACTSTALVESGVGHATRCAITPFVGHFNARKRALVAGGASADDVRGVMEVFNVGRLRIAAKGVARRSMLSEKPVRPEEGRAEIGRDVAAELAHDPGDLVTVDRETQRRMGMYMIGEIATLRSGVVSLAELHEQVADGGGATLARLAAAVPGPAGPAGPLPPGEPLAIVGIGCMFPDAPDLRAYWQNLVRGHDAVRELPADRWSVEQYYSPDRFARDMVYSKWGGLLPDVSFDPLDHQIPPLSLFAIEPVQMLALEAARAALADAGYDRGDFPRQRTSVVIAAAGMHDLAMRYGMRTMMREFLAKATMLTAEQRQQMVAEMNAELPEWTEDSFPGILTNVIAGRISNRFDLGGPNFTVDAACASSLAALHAAAAQLRSGHCDAALVGAADGNSNAFCYMCFSKTHALSPDGRSRSFDASADGIGLGEGVAAIVVKRLRDAERDGDQIYALIRGIGGSSDGRGRSLTAPAAAGQRLALERAFADAGVSPTSVSFVEAHATGTKVGDRVECEVLADMFSTAGAASVAVGSVKSMIGHAKTAAGLAGVIKTALALKHRVLPPTIGVTTPNAGLQAEGTPLYVNVENRPWLVAGDRRPRRAGVSAFGFGGTNFHAVLEEHDGGDHDSARLDLSPRPCELFAWRRGSPEELLRAVADLERRAADLPAAGLAALAAAHWHDEAARPEGTAAPSRLAVVASSVADLRRRLAAVIRDLPAGRLDETMGFLGTGPVTSPAEVCFVYPGQGSQKVDMLRDLVAGNPDLHHLFEAADDEVRGILEQPLSGFVYPPPALGGGNDRLREAVHATQVAQPAMAVADLFCHELLGRYGIAPALVAGHSFGEYVALAAADAISARGLFRLSALRGRAAYRAGIAAGGGMAAVGASLEDTVAVLAELGIEAHPANVNAPTQTVIGGTAAAIDAAVKHLPTKRISARRLPVTAAFHTPLLAAATAELGAHLATTEIRPPTRLVFSNTTGGLYPTHAAEIRDLLLRHLVEPVRFLDQIRGMHDHGARVFIEAGPGSVLTNLVTRNLEGRPFTAVAAAPHGRPGWEAWATLLARLWALGLPVRMERWFAGRRLPQCGVEELVRRTRERAAGKPGEWIVNSSVARPVSGMKQRRPAAPSPAAPAANPPPAAPDPHPPVATAAPRPAPIAPPSPIRPASSPLPGAAMIQLTTEHANHRNGREIPQTAGVLDAQQQLMMQWIELQMRQVEASGRFLDSHERITLACLNGVAGLPAVTTASARWPAPLPAGSERQPAAAAAPRPARAMPALAPRPVSPAGARTAPTTTGNGQHAAAGAGRPATPATANPGAAVATGGADDVATPAAANRAPADGQLAVPPPTEQFRKDLIAAVAERTGYPVEMLKEDALLEADLGIDSIKTVEIFGSLTDYHRFMPGGGSFDEELLAEFAQLKTLGDIIAMYDRGRTGSGPGAAPRPAAAAEAQQAGSPEQAATPQAASPKEPAPQSLERLEVRPVAAPAPAGEKKNYPLTTSS